MNLNEEILKNISSKIFDTIPKEAKKISSAFKETLNGIFKLNLEKLNLVSRDEFDIQTQILIKTRLKIEKLETQINEILKKSK